MSKERKAGLTVSLLFVGPLVLVACMLFAARDDQPNAAPVAESRSVQEAPTGALQPCPQCDNGEADWDDQQNRKAAAERQAAYDADRQLDERIREAANAAANAAVKQAMNEKPGY
jgi:hypothetical protein